MSRSFWQNFWQKDPKREILMATVSVGVPPLETENRRRNGGLLARACGAGTSRITVPLGSHHNLGERAAWKHRMLRAMRA